MIHKTMIKRLNDKQDANCGNCLHMKIKPIRYKWKDRMGCNCVLHADKHRPHYMLDGLNINLSEKWFQAMDCEDFEDMRFHRSEGVLVSTFNSFHDMNIFYESMEEKHERL